VQPDPLTMLRAAALHTHPLRAGIRALKYENHPELAPYLARYLTAVYQQPPWTKLPSAVDAVVPVPLHPQRRADRGYNQSELLAHAFGAQVGLPVAPAWLQRIRETRQQVGLGPAARHANVVDAFWADPAVAGRVLLLVDDVCTTGATLRACAAAAHAAGAAQVYALTLAIPVAAAAPAAPGLPWWEGQV
jgi:ComF family protein